MRNTLTSVVIFAAGAAIGSAVTWKLVKTKYEQIAKEEIDSVKEAFVETYGDDAISESKRYAKEVGEPLAEGLQAGLTGKPFDIREYADILKDMEYTSYGENARPKAAQVEKKEESKTRPYVISPDEFGEFDGYETVSLSYYADGVLTDDMDNVINDVDDVVGRDSLSHFGEYEDDSVFVRNDERRCDYEILLDPRKFIDVTNWSPHRGEDEWDETD